MTTGSLQSVANAAGVGSPDDHAALWEAFWEDHDRRARNELILAYESLVASVVNRLPANVKAYWEIDDLKSFGLLGLVEAIERWQPSTSATRFAAYAMKRIRGAIFDELRRLDWLPRTVRRRVISYRTTADALSSELGRQPETAEVLSQMGTDGSANADILAEIQSAQLLHLHHSVGSEDDEDLRLIDLIVSDDAQPEVALLASERLAEVRAAVTKLPERQRTVVTLHFLGGLTQEQIGAMLGVSNSRICQIEASAIQTLRRILADRPLSANGSARAC